VPARRAWFEEENAEVTFVIAASAAGIKAIPSIVNAVVITSAFSSSNQALLAGTRVL
jgi:amino acid transporter